MRARELKSGQMFCITWGGIVAISPYFTVVTVESSRLQQTVYVTLPDGSQMVLKANKRIWVRAA